MITVNFAGKVKGDTVQGNVGVPEANMTFPFTAVKANGSDSSGSPLTYDRSRYFKLEQF
jgi:hypothetical protein